MWQQYKKINPEAEDYDAWMFCDGGRVGDRLARLVLNGKKTATAGSYIAYETEGEEIPQAGCYSVVLFLDGRAACVIRDTAVTVVPFNEVSAEHAFKEGEGSRSLRYWRRVHRRAFAPDYAAVGRAFDERGLCVLEEFSVVFS